MWPDWAIHWTLGNFLNPLATIILPKSFTFLCNFCIGIKIFIFSSEIILGNFYRHLAIFFWSHWIISSIATGWPCSYAWWLTAWGCWPRRSCRDWRDNRRRRGSRSSRGRWRRSLRETRRSGPPCLIWLSLMSNPVDLRAFKLDLQVAILSALWS